MYETSRARNTKNTKKTQCVRLTAHRTHTTMHCAHACTLYPRPGATPHVTQPTAPLHWHHHAAKALQSATHTPEALALHPGTNAKARSRCGAAKRTSGRWAGATRVEGSRRR